MTEPKSAKTLVIVESPTKARTIARFLPPGFTVQASVGHVRDLPNSAKEIPKRCKKLKWSRLGVDVENDFAPLYVIPEDKKKTVRTIRKAVQQADHIYFATDEDREGESISWHLLDLIQQHVKPCPPHGRLVFHEITKTAIRRSLEHPRAIDEDLVRAQETRRIVDRLYGYEVSPLLWKKMLPRLSAGRVQSVAVRLLVERERARTRFTGASYWSLKAQFSKGDEEFAADLLSLGGRRVATSRDFDPDTGKLRASQSRSRQPVLILDAPAAAEIGTLLESGEAAATVSSLQVKPFSNAPQAPYVTSTLQQEANSRLRFRARYTMRVAQNLYENGFITYMRTDSTQLSDEAKTAARKVIEERFGSDFLSPEVRSYKNTVKNAQEAHEAIRPAGSRFRTVSEVRSALGEDAVRLYRMIWRRTLASQMRNATGTNSTVLLDVETRLGTARFRARGKSIEFEGYLAVYSDPGSARDSQADARQRLIPRLDEGEAVEVRSGTATERRTSPPKRFTEGTLIRKLERLGIGRPSTWASIVDLVQARAYAFRKGSNLVPTFTAMAVVGLLEQHFDRLTDYAFTARLEDQLDAIARGELERLDYLKGFYYGNGHLGLQALVATGMREIDPRKVCGLPIGTTDDGKTVEVRIGRYGPFLSDGTTRCSVPEDQLPDEMDLARACELLRVARIGPDSLGPGPGGRQVYLLSGRFGPYLQLGKPGAKKGDVKRASLPRGMAPEAVNLEIALKLLALPRELGRDEARDSTVIATNGRFGPYVKSGQEIRSIPADLNVLEITLSQALELLSQKKAKRWTRARAEPIKVLGPHPETEKELRVLPGRYGPYVTDGKLNASLPKDLKPEDVTLERAVDLLAARAARVAASPRRRRPKRRARKS